MGKRWCAVYSKGELGRHVAAKLLTGDEPRRIAVNITSLPGLVKRLQKGLPR